MVADQEQLDVRASAQPPLEHAHGLDPAEAAAEDDDARHRTSSTPRSPATISPITQSLFAGGASRAAHRVGRARARTMTT